MSQIAATETGRRLQAGKPSSLAPLLSADRDRLGFQILLDSLAPPLAADATALIPAERQIGRDRHAAIDRDRPGPDAARHAQGALDTARCHHAAQSVLAIIGDADRVLVVIEGDHHEHGAEYLLSRDPHVVTHLDETGGLDEEAAAHVGPSIPARQQS